MELQLIKFYKNQILMFKNSNRAAKTMSNKLKRESPFELSLL